MQHDFRSDGGTPSLMVETEAGGRAGFDLNQADTVALCHLCAMNSAEDKKQPENENATPRASEFERMLAAYIAVSARCLRSYVAS